ncbi:hypothetical protein FACS1894211_16580 [Clostridia bacterium]|nr:hypothetical protein FACS1894211_16580 [Clostridia bacterium]
MKTLTAYTTLTGDAARAAGELAAQMDKDSLFAKYGVALAFCDPDDSAETALAELANLLPFPVIGCTSIGLFHRQYGFTEPAVSVTVLAADDCRFNIALSEPLTADNAASELKRAYETARNATRFRAKAVFALSCPNPSIPIGRIADALSSATGNDDAPVFGGLSTPNGVNNTVGVWYGGRFHTDRAAVLVLSGNCKPAFASRTVMYHSGEQKRMVTKAEGNRVYKVGDADFADYLRQCGLSFTKADIKKQPFFFNVNPLSIEIPAQKKTSVQTIFGLDADTGAGILPDRVPEGALVNLGILRKIDIDASSRAAISDLLALVKENEKDGYKYSSIFYLSSISRYFALIPKHKENLKALFSTAPKDAVLSGFYAWGQFCPIPDKRGRNEPATHSAAVTLMAL